MTYDSHKQHKVVHKLDKRLAYVESIVLTVAQVAAVLLVMIGFVGFAVTVFFDKIARGLWQEFGWMQVLGMILFGAIFLVGSVMISKLRSVAK